VPPENIELVWAANTIINFCAAPTAPLVWAMYADTADYSEWKWGRRATGLVFSAASFAQKFGWAIGGRGWLAAGVLRLPAERRAEPSHHPRHRDDDERDPGHRGVAAVAALWFYEIDEETVKRMSATSRRGAAPSQSRSRSRGTVAAASLPANAIVEHPEVAVGRSASDLPEAATPAATARAAPSRRGSALAAMPVPRRFRRRSRRRNSRTSPVSLPRSCTRACTDCASARTWWAGARFAGGRATIRARLGIIRRTRAGCAVSPARTGTNGRRASPTSSA